MTDIYASFMTIRTTDCFSGVDLSGGVCYFLWDRDNAGDCKIITHRGDKISEPVIRPLIEPGADTFIRQNEAISILHKVQAMKEKSFAPLVSPQTPFRFKVYISAAYGERGEYSFLFLGKPFYGEPESCCSQSYLVIGPFDDEQTCAHVISYIATKFFRFLVMLKKNAQLIISS